MKTCQGEIMLTQKDWNRAGDFKTAVKTKLNQGLDYPIEIEECIYWDFLESLPPLYSKQINEKVLTFAESKGFNNVSGIYSNSEPDTHNAHNGKPMYNTFFINGETYYYYGIESE
jgi:hypothetical protein